MITSHGARRSREIMPGRDAELRKRVTEHSSSSTARFGAGYILREAAAEREVGLCSSIFFYSMWGTSDPCVG